ncbi:MAG TPA: hypothetical protein HPP81_03435 [Deltaproteobacteria bacterium]|jgi:hypothetical protein|nr:hypothetical protein [Deltaproteobacteria bacterium]
MSDEEGPSGGAGSGGEDTGLTASGPALGNLGVVFRRVVRAASGLALGNLGVVFRRVVRATEAEEECAPAPATISNFLFFIKRLKPMIQTFFSTTQRACDHQTRASFIAVRHALPSL